MTTIETSRSRMDSPGRIALCVVLCLALTIIVLSPRLWLMRTYLPGTYQWQRAHTYLLQCAAPLRRDVEPAMLGRILPPLVSHALGLRGYAPLLIPFAGVIVLVGYIAVLLRRRLDDIRYVYGGTLLCTTTSAILVPLHWFGMNDAWTWLAQLAVAFGTARWTLPLACLLGPWVDERFVIGLPIALAVRFTDRRERWKWSTAAATLAWLAPYAAFRLALFQSPAIHRATSDFLADSTRQVANILPFAPIGWWMGLRAAWVPVVYAIREHGWSLGVAAGGTAAIMLWLASDISRSIAVLAPLALLGVFRFAAKHPEAAPRAALTIGISNLVLPAAHVVYTSIDLINPLPVEFVRLLRWL